MTFQWRGNMVVGCEPAARKTPLFTGSPRVLPPVKEHVEALEKRLGSPTSSPAK
jgi:hypothetical protein